MNSNDESRRTDTSSLEKGKQWGILKAKEIPEEGKGELKWGIYALEAQKPEFQAKAQELLLKLKNNQDKIPEIAKETAGATLAALEKLVEQEAATMGVADAESLKFRFSALVSTFEMHNEIARRDNANEKRRTQSIPAVPKRSPYDSSQ